MEICVYPGQGDIFVKLLKASSFFEDIIYIHNVSRPRIDIGQDVIS